MKQTLERLWNEYLLDKCASIDTDEERNLTKQAVELHEKANILLNKDQKDAVEKYVDALCDIEVLFAKKAFFLFASSTICADKPILSTLIK